MAAGQPQSAAHQGEIAAQLAVIGPHQPQATEGPTQAAQRVARIEHLEGVLQRIAAPAVHRRVDLDIAPGEHQQGGTEGGHHLRQDPLHIEQGHRRQIEDALRQAGEGFV